MEFDFSALLLALTLITGLVWLVDALLLRKRRTLRAASENRPQRLPVLVDYSRSLFPVILAVLVFRSFIAEPFRIPSGSMMPTLKVGDFILVNKFAYGLRWPAFNTKFLNTSEPQRGDVIVFRYPRNPREDYIKRVIGLPGDMVRIQGENVYINGKLIPTRLVGPYQGGYGRESQWLEANNAVLYRESMGRHRNDIVEMPGVVNPSMLSLPGCHFTTSHQGECKVPAHSYFVMGDNRDNSEDSRFWGFVPEKNLVGKAFLIWFSWRGPYWVDFKRIGMLIH